LRVLRAKSEICLSQAVVDAINDTCQQLEEVSGHFSLKISVTERKRIGYVKFDNLNVSFCITNTKLQVDYPGITLENIWKENPIELKAGHFTAFPTEPCHSLKKFEMSFGSIDVGRLFQIFPNLEKLSLGSRTVVKLEQQVKDCSLIRLPSLRQLRLEGEVQSGALYRMAASQSLKKVHLILNKIEKLNEKVLHLDTVLKIFPIVERLDIRTVGNGFKSTITNDVSELGTVAANDHPLRELSFHNYPVSWEGRWPQQLHKIDFNRYKQLQSLSFHKFQLGTDVILNTGLRMLDVLNETYVHKESFKLPPTLYHLSWNSPLMQDEVFSAISTLKNLSTVNMPPDLEHRVVGVLGNGKFAFEKKFFRYLLFGSYMQNSPTKVLCAKKGGGCEDRHSKCICYD